MILLIDAYNVLKQVVADSQATEQEKTEFIALIRRYARLKNVSIELVFDGGPYGLPDRVSLKNVTLSHSGAQESADDLIKSLIKTYKGREMLLVSTDRELGRYALSQGVDVIESADFYRLACRALEAIEKHPSKKDTELVKITDTRNSELDALMIEYTRDIKKGVQEDISERKISFPRKALSKRERQLEKKIRKL